MGDKEWFQVCSPQVQSHEFNCTPILGSEAHDCEDWKHTSASGGVNEVPGAVVEHVPLIQDRMQGRSFEVGRRQRHTSGVVLGHCSPQARLWLHCVWHSIEHRSTTTGQHP